MHPEDENDVELVPDPIKKPFLDRYEVKRKRHYMYRVAAALWGKGVPWNEALDIVSDAFNAVLCDDT